MEKENIELFNQAEYLKAQNEQAARHLLELDQQYTESKKCFENKIQLQESEINALKTDINKYTVPKPTPLATTHTNPITGDNDEPIASPAQQDTQEEESRKAHGEEGVDNQVQELQGGKTTEDTTESASEAEWRIQGNKRLECPVCGLQKNTKKQMERHMICHEDDEEDSEFPCTKCPYQAMNRDQLLEHLARTHRYLTCNKCNICFKSKQELNSHILDHHKSHKPCRNYASGSCEYEEEECRFKHIKLGENQQICYNCGVITQTVKDLMNHIKNQGVGTAILGCYPKILTMMRPMLSRIFRRFPPPGGNTAQWWEQILHPKTNCTNCQKVPRTKH